MTRLFVLAQVVLALGPCVVDFVLGPFVLVFVLSTVVLVFVLGPVVLGLLTLTCP